MATLERRIGLLFAGFLVLLLLAGGRALWLGGVKGASLSSAAASQQVTDTKLPAERGTIVDRKGIELAVSEPAADVSATPYLLRDPIKVARRLAPLLDTTPEKLVQKLARKDTGFVYLARGLPADKVAKIQKLDIPGVALEPGHLRFYPRQFLASQVLGSVGTDGRGLSGIEYAHNAILKGADGERRLVKDALGQSINVRDPKPARAGARVELSIDAAIQDRVEKVLADVGQSYSPKGATAIVMDPRTSEILALANWPRVDANTPWEAPPYATPGPRRRLHLRARLDLQVGHRGRRARGRDGDPRDAVRPAAADPGRRPDDRRVAPARLRAHDDRPRSSPSPATSGRSRSV